MSIEDYNLIATIIDFCETKEVIPKIANIIDKHFSIDDYMVIIFKKGSSPTLFAYGKKVITHNLEPFKSIDPPLLLNNPRDPASIYFTGAYLLDPYCEFWDSYSKDGFYLMSDITSPDFEKTEYFSKQYNAWEFKDLGRYIFQFTDDMVIHYSLGRHQNRPNFSDEDRNGLKKILPFIRSSIGKCIKNDIKDIYKKQKDSEIFHMQLEQRFLAFGTSQLTNREVEVTRLLLKGYSVKGISKIMNISPSTVQTHSKNIYKKLEVCSSQELFGLFIEALESTSVIELEDPLSQFLFTAKT